MKKAMIFAAGLGTRLRPLTNDRPKAMVQVDGMPLLEIQIRRLKALGFTEIVVNVHHFADLIIDFLRANDHFGLTIHLSDERDQLLDTGGGLWKARSFLADGGPFYLCNVDVLTDLNPEVLREQHERRRALVTLAVRNRPTSRYLLFGEGQRMLGWKNAHTGAVRGQAPDHAEALAFSGLHVIDPAIFAKVDRRGAFSIIDVYLDLMAEESIVGLQHDDTFWLDVGKPPELAAAAGWGERLVGG
ncbi:MAG: nucleotidyltransferase family protein [Bacteroidota bacterium]